MSGKSTFLRTAGVTAVLAQTIHTCLAEAYEAPVFTVRSCMGGGDDLLAGKSYYIVEVETVLSLVAAGRADAPHLFLLDELFRGTNAVERIAAAEAVLAELVGGRHGCAAARRARGDPRRRARAPAARARTRRFTSPTASAPTGSSSTTDSSRGRPPPATRLRCCACHGAPSALVSHALARAALLDDEREVRVTGSS